MVLPGASFCAGAGVHVLCEKPVAPRAAAFAPLLGPSVPGDRLMIGFMLRLHPGLPALKCWAGGRRGVAVNARSVALKAHVGGWRVEVGA